MFFINPGKKIIRGVGIAICVLLGLVFVLMIVTAAAFGSAKAVGVFGFDLFICESADYDSVPAGSAVIVTRCEPYDLESGNLVLYSTDPMDDNADLAMGYYADFKVIDGVYYLSLVNGTDSTVISETALVGKAGWCSPFLGAFITFMKSPWGVFVMAVIPCALLLLIDVIKQKSADRPMPEVVPQVKNPTEEAPQPQISVDENGSAAFRKSNNRSASADSVLFTYTASQKKKQPNPQAPTMSDKDVLSLLNAPSSKTEKQAPDGSPKSVKKTPDAAAKAKQNQDAAAKPQPRSESSAKPTLPAPVAAKRYIDNTVAPAKADVKSDTAELPLAEKPKKKKRADAFFAQSEAPQIGKGLAGKQSSKAIIDLEDALATTPSRSRSEGSRRSADILAAKNRSDLIPDDDDSRDKSRYEVDDILAGLSRRHHDQ